MSCAKSIDGPGSSGAVRFAAVSGAALRLGSMPKQIVVDGRELDD